MSVKTKSDDLVVFSSREHYKTGFYSIRGTRMRRGVLYHYEQTVDIEDMKRKGTLRKDILRLKKRIRDELGRYGMMADIKDLNPKQLEARVNDMKLRGWQHIMSSTNYSQFGTEYHAVMQFVGV